MSDLELTDIEMEVLELREIIRLTDIFFNVSNGNIYKNQADINALERRIIKAINTYKDSKKAL